MTPNHQPRAAIYCRVSTSRQDEDGTSLESQESACRAYAAAHDYRVTDVYREVHTGAELWERPQLTALRQAVRRRQVDVAIVHAIDRLSRDPVHLGVIVSEAEHAGVEVCFVTEPLDNSPEGQLIRFVRGYAAKVEHEKIRERVRRGKKARAEAGKLMPTGYPLYGYQWGDDKKTRYVEDPMTAPIVRRIFREAAAGVPLRSITAGLERDSIPSPTGRRRWGQTSVSKLVHHPAYMGKAFAWRYKSTPARELRTSEDSGRVGLPLGSERRGAYRQALRPEDEWIPLPNGVIPPLVDRETWEHVQVRLIDNKAKATRNNRYPQDFLLRGGYARCSSCSGPMMCYQNKGVPSYRCVTHQRDRTRCTNPVSIKAAPLDAEVWQAVKRRLLTPEIIAHELASLRQNDPTDADLASLDRALADVDRRRRNLVDRLADTDDADLAALVTEKLAALSTRRRELEAERAAVQVRRDEWELAQRRLEDLIAWCRHVAAKLAGFGYEQRRLALDALNVRVTVLGPEHTPRHDISAQIPLTAGNEFVFTSTGR